MGLRAVGRVERDRQLVTVLGDAQPRDARRDPRHARRRRPRGRRDPRRAPSPRSSRGTRTGLIRVGGPHGETVGISVARLPGASTPDVVERALAAVAALRAVAAARGDDRAGLRSGEPRSASRWPACATPSSSAWRSAPLVIARLPSRLARRAARGGAPSRSLWRSRFVGMRLAHQTLNLMSLGGMAVAIGLVVDDAIVVVEAIARHRDGGFDASSAAATGAIELAPAVVGTTLTTVVVFVAARVPAGRRRRLLPRAGLHGDRGGRSCRSPSRSSSCPSRRASGSRPRRARRDARASARATHASSGGSCAGPSSRRVAYAVVLAAGAPSRRRS